MTIYEFLDDLIDGKPLGNTVFEKGQNPDDLYVVASRMLPCSARSLALAFCYAKGYGVKRSNEKFEEELLSSLKYQDYRSYLWLIRAYTTGLHLGEDTIKIEGKQEKAKELIELSNPLVANYYNTQHRYKMMEQLQKKAEEEAQKERQYQKRLERISKTESEIVHDFNKLSDEDLIEKLNYVSHSDIFVLDFLKETLVYALQKKKSEKVIKFIHDELIRLTGDSPDEENLHYFPVIKLMEAGYFKYALRMLELSEDPDCSLNGDGWVFLQQGICHYHLGNYDKAIGCLYHAANLGDYSEIIAEYEELCYQAKDKK